MRYLTFLILAAMTIWMGVWALPDNNIRVIFCDVGQGDAILVTFGNYQMLVDGGPGKKVSECLSSHIPFYDRQIEVAVLTHRNSDHENGLKYVLERYIVLHYEPALRAGDTVSLGEAKFEVLAPDARVLGENTISTENDLGIVGVVRYKDFDVLLTGDVQSKEYSQVIGVEVVKVPHHGSKYGVDVYWWEQAKPELAVVSVGSNNSYGHPAPEVLKILEDLKVKLLRTDQDGTIEIVSDGVKWWVK